MAKGDTKTNQYLDIAANGTRADLPAARGCCNTRTQDLIVDVADRIITEEETRAREDAILQGEIDEIKNNPDVYDIVPTYAALQEYDTSGLTDKDIIRVLSDETHGGASTYYRWSATTETFTYIGEVGDYYTKTQVDTLLDGKQDELTAGDNITIEDESGALVISATDTTYSDFTGTDGTTAGTAGLVPAPTTTDGDKYLKGDGTWGTVSAGSSYTAGDGINISAQDVISATNTGKSRVLTTDDYNWPTTGTKTAVALWLLDDGIYYAPEGVNIRRTSTTQGWTEATYIITQGSTYTAIVTMGSTGVYHESANRTTGAQVNAQSILIKKSEIINNLTSNYTDRPLSANQGKVLKDLVDSLAIRATGAPTTSTAGQVGTLYEDTTNGDLYICTDATNPYVWVEVGAGGGGSGVTELTSADYNWPTNNPTGVAVWLLDEGIYSANGINIWSINTGVSTASDWLLVVAKKATISSGDGDGIVYHFPTGAEAFIRKGYRTDGSGATAVNMGVNVVQTAGNNQWDVMSQNAVTSMVFADPSIRQKI